MKKSSFQIVNFNWKKKKRKGLWQSLPLDFIINQVKKMGKWKKLNIKNIFYIGERVEKPVNKKYHLFNYGYNNLDMVETEYDDVNSIIKL